MFIIAVFGNEIYNLNKMVLYLYGFGLAVLDSSLEKLLPHDVHLKVGMVLLDKELSFLCLVLLPLLLPYGFDECLSAHIGSILVQTLHIIQNRSNLYIKISKW